jgi:hypothetical protein
MLKITPVNKEDTEIYMKLSAADSVADPDLGSGIQCFVDPWIWDPVWKKNRIRDPRLKISDHFSGSLLPIFWIKKTLILCHPGWKNPDPG